MGDDSEAGEHGGGNGVLAGAGGGGDGNATRRADVSTGVGDCGAMAGRIGGARVSEGVTEDGGSELIVGGADGTGEDTGGTAGGVAGGAASGGIGKRDGDPIGSCEEGDGGSQSGDNGGT